MCMYCYNFRSSIFYRSINPNEAILYIYLRYIKI